MSMGRNASAKSLLQSKISNSKGAFNPRTGKLIEDEEEYIPKPQREKKEAAKSASSLRSQGHPVEVVRDTGLKNSLKATMEKRREAAKTPKVNINTDRGFVPDSQLMRQIGRAGTTFQKSTAKDEKTRLYETNDSLLNPQEIIKKYSYVAQDRDMDYGTLRRAVNKGMQEVGRTLRGTNDNSQYERVAKLQAELQGRLKSASFTAGMLEGMGGDLKDAATKIIGNEGLTKQNEALKAQIAATKANNSKSAAMGRLTGEMAKAGAGYMTIGKAAEKAALKGAGKLGQRMAAATAADGAQKLAAKVLFDPKKAKAAGFATRMLAQQAADTAVNTPITIINGAAEGKSRKEILQDFGKQEAMDAAFNLGLAGLGAGAKAMKNRSRKGPIAGIDFEKMRYDRAKVNDGLMQFREDVIQGNVGKKATFELAAPHERMAADIQRLTGVDVSSFKNRIKPNSIDHIEKRHGANGIQDHSMANPEDLAKLEYILNDYDNMVLSNKKTGGYRNSDGSPAKKVMLTKRINGTYYIVEAAPDSKAKTLDIVSVYKSNPKNEKKIAKSFDANSPQVTSKNVSQQPSNNSIDQNRGNVNKMDPMQDGNAIDYGTLTTADVKGLYDEQYRAQKAAEKMRRKKNLSEGDKIALQKLLRGEIDEATVRSVPGINGDDIMELYAVEKPLYDARKSVQNYKKYANEKKYKEVAEVVGDIPIRSGSKGGWRDLAPLRMARETQERILDMIAPTKEKAKQLKETLFDPIHTNERDRTLFKNEFIDRLKNTKISTKKDIPVKMPNGQTVKTSESALVQWLGENRYQLRQMEKKKGWATAEDIAKEQDLRRQIEHIEGSLRKDQLEKIDGAIVEMTDIYKEIHPKINEVLIRNGYDPVGYIEGYFPHMNFDDPNNIIEAAAQKLGFDFASKELPMDIAGRTETFRPGKKWAGNLLSRTGKETDYDALRAFDLYIDNISDVIYHTDDIKRLRAYEDYMRYTLSDDGIKERVDAIRSNAELSEIEKAKQIDEIYEGVQNHSLQNYVSNIRLYTDLLAGKKHKVDRVLETEMFGRKVYKVVNEMENRVAGNMVAANIGSALTNFIPITQGMSSMSLPSNLRGLGEALVYMSKGEMDEITKKSAFLATREGSDLLYKTGMRKFSDAVSKPMEWADKFSTQAVWRSRYYDNISKGMAEEAAIKNADEFARGLFAGRSKGAMPTAFSAKALKPLTMFQLEVNNQISYLLKDIPKEAQGSVLKMMKAYGGIIIGAYIYNDVYEKLTGRRSALDPFGIANETFGDLTGRQMRNTLDILGDAAQGDGFKMTEKVEKKKPSQAITALSEEIGGNIPFIGGVVFGGGRLPLQSAQPHPLKSIGAYADAEAGETREEKAWADIFKDSVIPVVTYLNPFGGGGQIRKTVQGLNMMRKGGNFTQTNKGERLQFAVDQDKKSNWVQAALFGKWATPEGQAHMEKKRTLSENDTETYEKLVDAGAKNTMSFETINRMRQEKKAKEQRRVIRSSLLSDNQKAILYHSITEKDSADRRILDHYQGTEHMGKAADCLMRMADYESDNPKKYILQNTNMPDAEKKYIYLEKIVKKDDREKETKKIDALMGAGIGMNDYIDIKNKYAQINASKSKTMPDDMSRWLREKGFTWQQQKVIKEQFVFWGMHPKKYKN
ncbi:MAG: hypothetical protein MR278_02810 [Bacteroidales bacterium]|nr:hypothetical protein [Anaerotignum sp.]MCI5678903.1 hypothetical protein [Bacteroidales bacterium]MDY3925909.1 hypothetical protein [Anaerotignum sp.]